MAEAIILIDEFVDDAEKMIVETGYDHSRGAVFPSGAGYLGEVELVGSNGFNIVGAEAVRAWLTAES